ncbi:unnamed protein product [Paramecium primaurelia]|uniref:Transmembrane protein n=1 Tax=Paramecium primaurelia TaxID=5886 RepID=A0A8S1JXG1_PARPR|nr:unnamed protein product [Paramecium primaurelia]
MQKIIKNTFDLFISFLIYILKQYKYLIYQGYILLNNFCYINDLRIENNLIIEQLDIFKFETYCLTNLGYYLPLVFNQCIPICGDGIITQDEECDDKLTYQSHICFNCKFQCPINCLQCLYGQCIQCIEGFSIQENRCYPKCRDQLIKSDKICEDDNNIQFDGCYKCQNSCQIECLVCQNTKCVQCISGWNLIQGKCNQICGDGQVAIISEEQCDDPQNLNCRNCQIFICNEYCKLCDNQQQCIICNDTFNLVNNKCINICGDGLLTQGFEECDDGNQIEFDGCYNCKYSCSKGCLVCQENNICLQCNNEEQFILDHTTHKCFTQDYQDEEVQLINKEDSSNTEEIQIIKNEDTNNNDDYIQILQSDQQQFELNCGNGKLQTSLNEECDDGNLLGGDGCSESCFNELSFKCQSLENQKSECAYIQAPDFHLNVITNSQNSLQIIDLTFSQQIKLNQNNTIESIADFQIKPETKYQLTIIPFSNLTSELNMSHYQFYIQFEQSVDHPIFTLRFMDESIINSENITIKSVQKSIQIGNPFVLSNSTKKKLTQIVSMNDAIMYTMISISALSFLIGNPEMFFNLLNLLQSFSYIRYVQYQFPPHLSQFLETYSKISLKLALDYLKVDQFLAQLNRGNYPQSKNTTLQTNQINQINQIFLVNAKSCYITVLTSYLTYLMYKIITSQQIDYFLNKLTQLKYENIKYLQVIGLFQRKIQQKCLKMKFEYFSKTIFQVYLTILHQFLFSTFMQFPNYSFESFFEALNSINSLFAIGLIIFINFKSLSITSQQIKNVNKWKFFFEESKSQFWASNYKSFQLYRVTIYIFLIVFFMNQPEIQTILLSLQSLIYLLYLYKVQPLKSQSEYIKLILREFIFLTTVGSFLIYSFNLTEEQYLICGWIHISMLSTILGINLFIDMIEFLGKLYANYQKKKLKLERKQQKNIQFPL